MGYSEETSEYRPEIGLTSGLFPPLRSGRAFTTAASGGDECSEIIIINNLRMAKTILFIEDEAALQKALTQFLSQEGYEAISALDGESGLALAREKKPDLILLDLIIPKKDGFAVLEELKKDESTKQIPVIILSNLEGSAEVGKALELGAETYLVKTNYSLQEVTDKIKSLLK